MLSWIWAAFCTEGVHSWHAAVIWARHAGEGVILQCRHPRTHCANQNQRIPPELQSLSKLGFIQFRLNLVHEASLGNHRLITDSSRNARHEMFALVCSWERGNCLSLPVILCSRIVSYIRSNPYYNANTPLSCCLLCELSSTLCPSITYIIIHSAVLAIFL